MGIAPGNLYNASFADLGSAGFYAGVKEGGGSLAHAAARYFVIYTVGSYEQSGFIALFFGALTCSLVKGEYIARHPDIIIKGSGGNADIGALARFG